MGSLFLSGFRPCCQPVRLVCNPVRLSCLPGFQKCHALSDDQSLVDTLLSLGERLLGCLCCVLLQDFRVSQSTPSEFREPGFVLSACCPPTVHRHLRRSQVRQTKSIALVPLSSSWAYLSWALLSYPCTFVMLSTWAWPDPLPRLRLRWWLRRWTPSSRALVSPPIVSHTKCWKKTRAERGGTDDKATESRKQCKKQLMKENIRSWTRTNDKQNSKITHRHTFYFHETLICAILVQHYHWWTDSGPCFDLPPPRSKQISHLHALKRSGWASPKTRRKRQSNGSEPFSTLHTNFLLFSITFVSVSSEILPIRRHMLRSGFTLAKETLTQDSPLVPSSIELCSTAKHVASTPVSTSIRTICCVSVCILP